MMQDFLFVWGRRIGVFALFYVILDGAQRIYIWGAGNFENWLVWAGAHDSLSGWAQAVGSIIAIFIAIAVPAYQSYSQRLDARRADARTNHTRSLNCFYLLGDVRNSLRRFEGVPGQNAATSGGLRNDLELVNLLQRIDAAEVRETDWRRVTMLYGARNNILLAERLRAVVPQDAPINPQTLALILSYGQDLDALQTQAEIDKGHAGQMNAKLHCSFFVRLTYHVGRNKTRLPVEK